MVTDIAHELRTPLTNLRGQIEAVEDGLLPPSPATVRSLREEVLLLTRLVEDLQTLSIAEAGRLALDRSPTSVRELVERALEGFRIAAADGGVQLRNDVEEFPRVDADAGRVGQVLRNLLANAIRHTPPGGVVAVSARTEGDVVAVTVTDTGRGIDPDHLPHVFERFHRSDPSRSRTTGGAGLGLAIVKSLVEAHGGDVSASSAPGAGSAFRFTLPRVSR
jgi:two-component system sensor histidine kinase BaeS